MALFWLALAFVLGILAGSVESFSAVPFVVAGCTASIIAVGLWKRSGIRFSLILFACFLLGAGRFESIRTHITAADASFYNGRVVTIVGYVNTEPDARDTGNNYVLSVQQLIIGSKIKPLSGGVEVHTAASQLFDEGDQIELTGALLAPTNSATIPYASILANRGIYSEMSFPKGFVVGHVSLGLVGVADSIRASIEKTIRSAMPEPEATFLIALLIGARSAQLGALAPVLIQTGLIHLIAISGIKIAIVAGTVHDSLKLFVSRLVRLALSSAILLSYWLISGATVAGLRASLMWLLIFAAAYLGRPTFGLVSLGVAVSIMLAINPNLLWDTGFQLTAVATAAISLFTPVTTYWLRFLPGVLRASLATTLAAQVGVLPIQIATFNIVSPVSLLANAVVLPFVPLTMALGFAAVIFPGWIFTSIAYGLVHVMILIARWAASLPFIYSLSSLPVSVTLAYYVLLIGLGVVVWRLGNVSSAPARGEWLFGLGIAAIGLSAVMSPSTPGDGITFPVPGSALLTWHGRTVLIDGGTKPSVLLTALGQSLAYPNAHINAVIDTSTQAKNVASLLQVIQTIPVDEVLDPGLEYPSQTYARWRATLSADHIPTYALRAGLTLRLPGLTIQCLAPDSVRSNAKDDAGIIEITTPNQRIIYLGDASATEQQDLPFQQSVRAGTIISAVPLDPTFAAATEYRALILPQPGHRINLNR